MKTFNKVISLVTVAVFVLSMMVTPAFAAGLIGFQTPTGNEKLTVTYYSDSALTSVITKAKTGDTVYAKVTANVPTKTLSSLTANVKVTNATIEKDDLTVFSSLADFERPALPGTNVVSADKASANLQINKKTTASFDSPTNYEDYMEDFPNIDTFVYKNIDVASFDVTVFTLNVTGSTGNVAFALDSDSGIGIGELDEEEEDIVLSPFTIEGTLAIDSGSTVKKNVSYDATLSVTEYDATLSETDLKAEILKNLTVTKTTDGGAPVTLDNSTLDINVDTTTKTITVDFMSDVKEDETLVGNAEKQFTYTLKAPVLKAYEFDHFEFNGTTVDGVITGVDFATYAKDEAKFKADFKVKIKELADGTPTGNIEDAVIDTDYGFSLANYPTNDATLNIEFKGRLLTSGNKALTIYYTDIPVEYSNIKAELTTTEFANNTPADTVKSAVKVTATKTEGFKVGNIILTLGADYDVEIYGNPANVTENGYVTVTLKGEFAGKELTPLDGKLIFGVTPATTEYKDYVIEFEGGNTTFLATATDDEIKAKMTVKADKYVNGSKTGTEEVAPANFENVHIDRETGLVTVTLKAGEPYNGETVTATITLKDVIEYRNVKATMSTRMFPAGTTDDTIKGALTIVADKYVNNVLDGAEQSALPASEYTVDVVAVDANNKTVKITYLEKCISVADAYKEFAVAVGINANAKITLSPAGTVSKDENFTAEISVEGLGTNKVYAAEIKISADKGTGSGTLVSFTPAAGYYKYSENMADGTVTVIRDTSETAGNILGTFTIKAAAVKDAEIVVKVEKLKLTTVEGDDIANLPSFTGDEKRIIVTEVVVPTTAKINASFNIQTLGDVASAADKFKAGLKVTKGTDAVTLGADNVVVTEKKVELKDLEVGEGVYKVSLGVPGYTKAEVEIKVAYDAESNTMKVDYGTITGKEAIYAGDVNGDGVIDAVDYADLVAKIGQAVSENKNCDLYTKDGETVINLNDVITMVYEFETFFGKSFSTSGLILE